MAQPLIDAFYSTRKRAAIDEVKSNRARKVLIVDEGEGKLSQTPISSLQADSEDVDSEKACTTKKLEPINIKNAKTRILIPMAKNTSKPHSGNTRKKVNVVSKGQQNLKKFITKLPVDETDKSTTSLAPQDSNIEHITPPSSPVKLMNAMDKVSDKPKDTSLNALTLKLSRSSRLAELKASLSRFNESHNKLKEIEKTTSTISTKPAASPKLQSFKSIELEVNLSPQKIQSPEKLYLSPKKDVTARKNLLNLLSPTKNSVAMCESPSKKIYELTAKPALTLPFKYRYIAEMFRSVDTVCQLLFNRKETITLSRLKPAVEKMTKRNMTIRCLAQIKHIYPEAFKFHYEKLRVFGTGKFEEKWELVVSPSVAGSERLTSDILLSRKRVLFDLLLDKAKQYHHEFLMELEPPMLIPKNKITRWHPEFDIERVPDIVEGELPEPPDEQKLTSGQEVLERARQMFNCNSRMEEALERLKAKRQEGTVEKIEDNTPPNSILKGIPKALLEKVRQKQAAKALVLMTRSADKEEELKFYSRLPELARLTRNLFVSEKKSVLPLETVVDKLGNCYRISLTKSEMENHIEKLAKELPDWLVIHSIKSRNTRYVHLNKSADFSIITNKLESLTEAKSNK